MNSLRLISEKHKMTLGDYIDRNLKKLKNGILIVGLAGSLAIYFGGMNSILWEGDVRRSYEKLEEMKKCTCGEKIHNLENRILYGKKKQKRGNYLLGGGIALTGLSILSLIGGSVITDDRIWY